MSLTNGRKRTFSYKKRPPFTYPKKIVGINHISKETLLKINPDNNSVEKYEIFCPVSNTNARQATHKTVNNENKKNISLTRT